MCRSGPAFWFYKAQSLSEKVNAMSFSAFLKNGATGLVLTGVAFWFAGCGDTAPTPPAKSGSTTPPASTPPKASSGEAEATSKPKVNSDGSVSKDKPKSAAGSETDDGEGRDVPNPAPPETGDKPAGDKAADDKPADEKPADEK